jgi:hypothetical protein
LGSILPACLLLALQASDPFDPAEILLSNLVTEFEKASLDAQAAGIPLPMFLSFLF